MTALHHSREPTTLSMILAIFFTKLHELIHRDFALNFFDMADILFVPFVNRDGYDFITKSYNTSDWEMFKLKRKNFNHTIACPFFKKLK